MIFRTRHRPAVAREAFVSPCDDEATNRAAGVPLRRRTFCELGYVRSCRAKKTHTVQTVRSDSIVRDFDFSKSARCRRHFRRHRDDTFSHRCCKIRFTIEMRRAIQTLADLSAVTQESHRSQIAATPATECLRAGEGRVSSSGARTSLAAKQILASHRAHRQDGDRHHMPVVRWMLLATARGARGDFARRNVRAANVVDACGGRARPDRDGTTTTISNGASRTAVAATPGRGPHHDQGESRIRVARDLRRIVPPGDARAQRYLPIIARD